MNARSITRSIAQLAKFGNARTDGRTDGLTEMPWSPYVDISRFVTRTRTYGIFLDG